jgi:hypothetical protein
MGLSSGIELGHGKPRLGMSDMVRDLDPLHAGKVDDDAAVAHR